MQGELREYHQLLWQTYGIVAQQDGQTLWQNKNARLPYLRDLVLSHAVRKAKTVRAAAIQAREFQSEFGWDEFKSMAVKIWLLRMVADPESN